MVADLHPSSREIRGLIDCDGTLADTMPLHWHAWSEISRRYGLNLTRDRLYSLGGIPSRDIIRILSSERGVKLDHLAVVREKESLYLPLLDSVGPVECVVNIARQNADRIPMAVASGGTQPIICEVLERLGIRELFQAVVTSEQVTRQKPAPDIFLEAARRIGVPPQHCRGYEDTDLGMEAIRAAGMEAVDVRHLLVQRA